MLKEYLEYLTSLMVLAFFFTVIFLGVHMLEAATQGS